MQSAGLRRIALAGSMLVLSAAPPSGQSADYYPLAVNSRWTYTVSTTGGFLGDQDGTSTTLVQATELVKGQRYFRVNTSFKNLPFPTESNLFRKTATALYRRLDDEDEVAMPLPLKVGLEWSTRGAGDVVLHHRVESLESVKLGTQTFENCFKIQHSSVQAKSFDYYAPNVGLIKTVGQAAGSRLEFTLATFRR